MPHHQTPNTAIPTKTHPESPKTHQAVTSKVAIGVHVAWNFVQGGIFGSDISGTGSGRGLIEARFTGPDLLTGGVMGIEGSVVTFVLGTATGLAMLLAVRQRGLVVPPDS